MMKYLDLTFSTPEANLACDEALLDWAEETGGTGFLRFWESPDYFVVLGYSNKARTEVRLSACRAAKIPVLRRPSGGGTVLQGPGCLNYSLILPIQGPVQTLVKANRWIMQNQRRALQKALKRPVAVRGITDLALRNLKFSGNAQRRKRLYLLFHGTFLYDFDLSKIRNFLNHPAREPEYRKKREHHEFVANVPLKPSQIKAVLRRQWRATRALPENQILSKKTEELVASRYSQDSWNLKF